MIKKDLLEQMREAEKRAGIVIKPSDLIGSFEKHLEDIRKLASINSAWRRDVVVCEMVFAKLKERQGAPAYLVEALNSGDGTYKS